MIALEDLFDAKFLASLKGLRIVARRVPRAGRPADQRSRALGAGIEFRDFRGYAPGDDFRAIDWNLYQRLGRVFLRLYEEQQDLPLYLAPDISTSMFAGDPPRARAALRTTLALASISLGQHDRVGIYPFGSDLVDVLRPAAGAGRLLKLARHLAGLEPAGATDMARSVRTIAHRRLRPGLLTIVSDFFDPAGLEPLFAELRHVRHRLLFVQLARAEDAAPTYSGDVRLRDCETGAHEDITITPATLQRYQAAYARFESALTEFARRRGAGLLRLDADAPIVPQLARLFEGGRYVA